MNLSTLKIRIYGDYCLRKKSIPVEKVGPGERMLIKSMIATMHQTKGIGLAAPQIGINQRFFVVDVGNGPIVIVNPRITKKSGLCVLEEGCLSVPEIALLVERSEKITVQYTDENNQKMEMTCDDLLARVIQHETDHLDGKLIIDHASRSEKAEFKDQLEILEVQQKG